MPKRVLVVEDNDVNFALVEFVLGKLDVAVARAATGAQALDLAERDRPDLIYMDVHLPDVTGLELTRQLRLRPYMQGVPIVALTALAMAGDRERALDAGCTEYMSKPLSPRLLQETTARLLDLKAAAKP